MNNRENEKDLATALRDDEARDKIIQEVQAIITDWHSLQVPEQIKRRNSILCSIPILAEQDRKLCIKRLAKEGIVNLREALEKIKKYARDMGIDKDDAPPINYAPNLTLITPAQDFINDVAYVTIPVNVLIGSKMEQVNYLITSERQKIRLVDEELLKLNLYMDRKPYLSLARWSDNSITAFLENKEKIEISKVFQEIYELLLYYVDFGNPVWAKYKALWIIGSYLHRLFETYPYVHLNGDMESGKTKTLMFTAWLSFNGEITFNSSPSYVVRAVHNNHATCCIDEVERLKRSDDQDSQLLIAMHNSGYKKGSYCGKSEQFDKNGQWIPKQFEAYSPKVFASIRGLEPSLSSRCIPIIMLKTGNKEIKNRELSTNDHRFQGIRNKLYHVMLTNFESIRLYYQNIKDEEILGREWELWKPILSIAKVIDAENDSKSNLYTEIRNHAIDVQKLKREARKEETPIPKVLAALKDAISSTICPNPDNFWPLAGKPDEPSIIKFLIDSGEEEFAWLNDENKHTKGKWVGRALRTAGVVEGRAEQRKIGGKNVKGFCLSLEKIEEKQKNYEV